jgi:LTXXQ motif family protein
MLRRVKSVACIVAALTIFPALAFAALSAMGAVEETGGAVHTPSASIEMAQASPAQPPSGAQGKPSGQTVTPVDRVETRIGDLHRNLRITKDQEPLWHDVAQAMRDEAHTADAFFKDRAAHGKTMTAVEDLNSYQEFMQARADGLKKVATAFQALYESMPDDQKKNADAVFRKFQRQRPSASKPKSN